MAVNKSRSIKKRKRNADNGHAAKDEDASFPKKKFYRQRAHANPFSDHSLSYSRKPALMDWSTHYPAYGDSLRTHDTARTGAKTITVADIGCGFGGLLVALAPQLPGELLLGLEIRSHVADFVQDRIKALRSQNSGTSLFQNISCLRANTMKFLPNLFRKAQLTKVFLCFPDPHFKARKHKARIVSTTLNSEYAFVMRPGGILYTITDVADLHKWMITHFDAHPSFARLSVKEEAADVCVAAMKVETEEGRKVERNKGQKLIACFQRLDDPPWAIIPTMDTFWEGHTELAV